MIHLVTFATDDMSRSRELCIASALRHGVNDYTDFRANWSTDQGRGFGYWRWKPEFIDLVLDYRRDGDYLIYSDAGVEFIGDVNHIIDRMDQDIFLFGNMWEHAHWCKRDIVETIWPRDNDDLWRHFGKQVQASVIFFRVSDYVRKFVREWLDWCLFEGGRLIDDSPSRSSNHPEFQENRHDQAILTTLAYREGIKLHWWPAAYNMDRGGFIYPKDGHDDTYPALFHHHRRRNHEWERAA